jgi:putative ABC transport system ATP-binding protein
MNPVIAAREVSKHVGAGQRQVAILRGISLEVARGETVFLVGPSGSGKTTLLSILGCILTPDQGNVEVLGKQISRLDAEERSGFRRDFLGFVFQSFNLFPSLSALDNVRLVLTMRGVSLRQAKTRALDLLAQVGLERRGHLRSTQLSTGECQRVAIARALANDPQVLFADEPTASLDADNGQRVMRMLSSLVRSRGMTLVVVTHDNRIFPFGDRLLRLEDGRMLSESSPRIQEALQEAVV